MLRHWFESRRAQPTYRYGLTRRATVRAGIVEPVRKTRDFDEVVRAWARSITDLDYIFGYADFTVNGAPALLNVRKLGHDDREAIFEVSAGAQSATVRIPVAPEEATPIPSGKPFPPDYGTGSFWFDALAAALENQTSDVGAILASMPEADIRDLADGCDRLSALCREAIGPH